VSTQPGIQLYGLEGRYAHALFSAASKSSALPKVETEMGIVKVCAQLLCLSAPVDEFVGLWELWEL